jgi:hypothetical protein
VHLAPALRLRLVADARVLLEPALGQLDLERGEPPAGRRGEVGQDDERADRGEDGERALDVEEPAPGGVPEAALHAVEDAARDERAERVADQAPAREQRGAHAELAPGVPLGEQEERAGEEGGLDEAEEEAREERADEVGRDAGQAGDGAPDHHAAWEVDGRPAGVVQEHVSVHDSVIWVEE